MTESTGAAQSGDAAPDDGRNESTNERLDRNWDEILQELRVTQTGTQILAGFLVTLAFQERFARLDEFQVTAYLTLVVLAAATTALALAPVALHRALFRHRAKEYLVESANRILQFVLVGVAAVLTGTLMFVFDVVIGRGAALVAGGLAVILLITLAVGIRSVARRVTGERART